MNEWMKFQFDVTILSTMIFGMIKHSIIKKKINLEKKTMKKSSSYSKKSLQKDLTTTTTTTIKLGPHIILCGVCVFISIHLQQTKQKNDSSHDKNRKKTF